MTLPTKTIIKNLADVANTSPMTPEPNITYKSFSNADEELTQQILIRAKEGHSSVGWTVDNLNPDDVIVVEMNLKAAGYDDVTSNQAQGDSAFAFSFEWY